LSHKSRRLAENPVGWKLEQRAIPLQQRGENRGGEGFAHRSDLEFRGTVQRKRGAVAVDCVSEVEDVGQNRTIAGWFHDADHGRELQLGMSIELRLNDCRYLVE